MGKHKHNKVVAAAAALPVQQNNTHKKKKKKGRPSLLDLQKRHLEQQQQDQLKVKPHKFQNPNPNYSSPPRRSTRRNPNPNPNPNLNPNPNPTTDDEDRSATKKREKKLKLLDKLPDEDAQATSSGSDSNPDEDQSSGSNPRKRKIGSIAHGSGPDDDDKSGKHDDSTNQTSNQQGSEPDDGPATPLPDQKLLLFILDRLQKKDTYGVFAEPVDPEELPDYHEIIAHPMDFSTVRKKLGNGSYASLEQFEKDVFLICSNAMEYNSPDTIYFRQARSIQELAKKSFENLRQGNDDNEQEPEPKVVRRGRPPKNLKRPPGRPPLQRANSDFSEATPPKNLKRPPGRPPLERASSVLPEATPPKTAVNNNKSNVDTRKPNLLLQKSGANLFLQSCYSSHYAETYIGWSAERYEKADSGSASKGILMKHGKKQIVLDESRRNTYNQPYTLGSRQEPSVLTTFDGERKQLIGVGLYTEYGYARSLARFADKLGPVAWKVAAKKIQRCLPTGVKFGPGWIGENEAPVMERPIPNQLPAGSGQPSKSSSSVQDDPPSGSAYQHQVETDGDKPAQNPTGEQSSSQPKSDDGPDKAPSSSSPSSSAGNETTQVLSSLEFPSNGVGPTSNAPNSTPSSDPNTTFNVSNSSTCALTAVHPGRHNQHGSSIQSRVNRVNGTYGLNSVTHMAKLTGASRPTVSNLQSTASVLRTETKNLQPPSAVNNVSGEVKLSENSNTENPNGRVSGSNQETGPSQTKLALQL